MPVSSAPLTMKLTDTHCMNDDLFTAILCFCALPLPSAAFKSPIWAVNWKNSNHVTILQFSYISAKLVALCISASNAEVGCEALSAVAQDLLHEQHLSTVRSSYPLCNRSLMVDEQRRTSCCNRNLWSCLQHTQNLCFYKKLETYGYTNALHLVIASCRCASFIKGNCVLPGQRSHQ